MTYTELYQIAKSYVDFSSSIPRNSFSFANKLGLPLRNEKQCEEDYHGGLTPLCSCPAFLATRCNEKIVYFNSRTRYWNFYIFHEISHHILGHTDDSSQNESDANMLASILIAPVDVLPSYLKSARDLSCLCNIPIDRAEEYWEEIYSSVRHDYISELVNDYLSDIHSAVGRLLRRVESVIDHVS